MTTGPLAGKVSLAAKVATKFRRPPGGALGSSYIKKKLTSVGNSLSYPQTRKRKTPEKQTCQTTRTVVSSWLSLGETFLGKAINYYRKSLEGKHEGRNHAQKDGAIQKIETRQEEAFKFKLQFCHFGQRQRRRNECNISSGRRE